MKENVLRIIFLSGTTRKIFLLPLKSVKKLEAAGITLKYIYELDVYSSSFSEFYRYVRGKYGVTYDCNEVVVTEPLLHFDRSSIEVEQIDPRYPWRHLLIVDEGETVEKIIFYPETCEEEENE
jgi:hypothetical protein